MQIINFPAFLTSSILLIAAPGPSTFYVASRGATQGSIAGMVAVLGVEVGTLLHVFVAAIGVSLIASSELIDPDSLRAIEGVVLIMFGVHQIVFCRFSKNEKSIQGNDSLKVVFWQGVLIDGLNLQNALFFMVFLPQFIPPNHINSFPMQLLLGVVFVLMAIVGDSVAALGASAIARFVSRWGTAKKRSKVQNYLIGTVYLVMGIWSVS